MAGRRPAAIRPSVRAQVPAVDDPGAQRAFDALTDAVHTMQEQRKRDKITFNLVVGVNRISHGLGRPYEGATVTPYTANLGFGWGISSLVNPRPDLEVWIEVVGADCPRAAIEVF